MTVACLWEYTTNHREPLNTGCLDEWVSQILFPLRQINHSDNAKNRYSGWPAEIQVEGCIPKGPS